MNGNPHDVHIEWDDTREEFVVTPSRVVKRNDTITFHNDTKKTDNPSKVSIQFCQNDLVGEPFELLAGKKITLPVHATACVGLHCFAVFCHETMKYAVAASMPIIIVDP